jgi:hypothetical protein
MGQHSILAPSSAAIWGKSGGCTGSVLMAQAYPEEEGEAAREGTAAHRAAELMINGAAPEYVLNQTLEGVVITPEIVEAAELYAGDVLAAMENAPGGRLYIEELLQIPSVNEECYGTPDAWLFNPDGYQITIWDYKHGFGLVEAKDNWQCICYAAGIMDALGINGAQDQHLIINIRIIQPRGYHAEGPIRSWRISGSDLRAYINILASNALEALGPGAKCRPGTHCRYCPARHACSALQQATMGALDYLAAPMPHELDPASRSLEYTMLLEAQELIKYRITGLEEIIKNKIKEGEPTPGYSLEVSQGREQWINDPATVIELGKAFGVDLSKPGVLTPNQAIKAGMDKATVKYIVARENKGTKLVPDNNSTLASRVFKSQE